MTQDEGLAFQEHIAPDEDAQFRRLALELKAMQEARARKRSTAPARALHAKAHVGAVGHLDVSDDLPEALRVAVFADKKSWPVYVRFSNGSGARAHDAAPDVRGLSIKLVGVPGKKLLPGLEDKKTQDFLLIQTPALPVKNPDEFSKLAQVLNTPGSKLLVPLRFVRAFGVVRTLQILKSIASMPAVTSMATVRFYTAAPVRYGKTAAKLALFPVPHDAPSVPSTSPLERDFLREDLIARLRFGPIEYSLRVQLFVDDKTTPIEDTSVEWPESRSPFVEVARLIIPKQDVPGPAGKAIDDLVETLSFDPWHAVPELRPVGAVMRARAHAYRESSIARGTADEPETVLPPG